jgi:NAD(P)-dependent dehydrogenase (short-subunit alcohol dehydrogenase family)
MSEPGNVTSRVCLVTGASRGIGLAVATQLVAAGHRVGMAARSADLLDKAAAELGENALAIPADITDAIGIDLAYQALEKAWGPVEVLVANAGAGVAAPLVDTTDELWQRMLDLNLTAPFRCIRRGLPSMVDGGWGRVVVIASVVAKHGEAEVAAYTASKHGVLGLVRSAAAEVARAGVTVNAICPGYVDSPMTDDTVAAIVVRTRRKPAEARQLLERRQPIGRLIDAGEVAAAVRFCIDNAAVNGQGINVDGGAVQS